MTKKLYIIMIFCLSASLANAQEQVRGKDFRTNMAIPDLPAFNMINKDPSDALRPSTTKELSTSFSNFSNGESLFLPRNIGVEISPVLLLSRDTMGSGYYDNCWNRIKESFRISVASIVSPDDISAREAAIGIRVSLVNRGNLNGYLPYRKAIYENLEKDLTLTDNGLIEYLRENPDDKLYNEMTPEEREAKRKEAEKSLKLTQKNTKTGAEELRKIKEKFEEENWNASKLDLAIGVRGLSPDSVAKNLRYANTSVWLNGAIKVKKFGQLMYGFKANFYQIDTLIGEKMEEKAYMDFSLPARFYFGSNKYKVYGEGQIKYTGFNKAWNSFYSVGAEVEVVPGTWVVMNGGWERNITENNSGFRSTMTLRFAVPD